MQPSQPAGNPRANGERLSDRVKLIFTIASCIAVVAVFYTVENWRGKWSWERCKQKLTAVGAKLDWSSHIPAPIPDEENLFKAPQMTEWFVHNPNRPTTDLERKIDSLGDFLNERNALAEFIVVQGDKPAPQADIEYRFQDSAVSSVAIPPPPVGEVMPLIIIVDAPLPDAIRNLAKQADIAIAFDAQVLSASDGGLQKTFVSLRWENVTQRQALLTLLDNHNLKLVANPDTGVALITNKDSDQVKILMQSTVAGEMAALIQTVVRAAGAERQGTRLAGSQGFTLEAAPRRSFKAAQIVMRADRLPTSEEVAVIFNCVGERMNVALSTSKTSETCFWISHRNHEVVAAADYLEWSDRLREEFDVMRAALTRPRARIDGKYHSPFLVPLPHFVTVRQVAQILSQRAQCFLLLDKPDKALEELVFLNELRSRILNSSSSQSRSLVTAMIDVAVVGLFERVIEDGFNLRQWQASHLAALGSQLEPIDLPSSLLSAFKFEPAAVCKMLESVNAAQFRAWFITPATPNMVFRDPETVFFGVAPRGWIYQNMVTVAELEHTITEGFDPAGLVMFPERLDRSIQNIDSELKRRSPFTILAEVAVPNFIKAAQTAARNQSFAKQALIACALERYRLAHNAYPESLEPLSPQFVETVPRDVIGGQTFKYRRNTDGTFLLYSVAWNEKDDGGTTGEESFQLDQLDWVWPSGD